MSQPSILSFFKKPGTAVAAAKSAPSRKRPRSVPAAPSPSSHNERIVEKQRDDQPAHVDVTDCNEHNLDQQAVQSPKQHNADSETTFFCSSAEAEQSHSIDSSSDDADASLTDDEAEEPQHSGSLSAFELQRLANIKRNNAFLSSLGLAAAKPAPLLPAAASKKRKSSSTVKRTAIGSSSSSSSSSSSLPARRSSRLTGDKPVCYNEDALRVLDDNTIASKQVRIS
jgi:hypothetical protein